MTEKKRLIFDEERCMGCSACEIACKMEYQLPRGIRFIIMRQAEDASLPNQKFRFSLDLCRHCQDAPCIAACPSGAIEERADGIIVTKAESCTGCRLCLPACPYGVPGFQKRDDGKEIMRKCNLCAERIDAGLDPACVRACPAGALRLESV